MVISSQSAVDRVPGTTRTPTTAMRFSRSRLARASDQFQQNDSKTDNGEIMCQPRVWQEYRRRIPFSREVFTLTRNTPNSIRTELAALGIPTHLVAPMHKVLIDWGLQAAWNHRAIRLVLNNAGLAHSIDPRPGRSFTRLPASPPFEQFSLAESNPIERPEFQAESFGSLELPEELLRWTAAVLGRENSPLIWCLLSWGLTCAESYKDVAILVSSRINVKPNFSHVEPRTYSAKGRV